MNLTHIPTLSLRPVCIALALLPCVLPTAFAAEDPPPAASAGAALAPQVVTAAPMDGPLVVTTDPAAPRQPIPAQDGAEILRSIPGFSVIRKGGTDGDPVLRGMAGSRLNILIDDEHILGGCGARMDPPTAYVFPETYDRITVLKGPQSVTHGPGAAAGTVRFERRTPRFDSAGWRFDGSLTAGSFGRNDQVADLAAGTPGFFVRALGSRTDADDYEDGDGNTVHSRYTRWNGNAILGWTPDADTRVELSATRSDGRAAYADRGMDGARFARENLGLKFERRNLSPLIQKLEARLYYNYVDHVMDNFSLRAAPGMRMLSNPDRLTRGARVAATLQPAADTQVVVGVDHQYNSHTIRGTPDYRNQPREEDALFRNTGAFGELTHYLSERDRLVAGLRADRWEARDSRTAPVATAGERRRDTLPSGFVRFERDLGDTTVLFAGLGHSERFPDYWELVSQGKESLASNSAFDTEAEKTTQLDLGATHREGPLTASLSAFYGRIDDYILIDNSRRLKDAVLTRNVAAVTWGVEADLRYALNRSWTATATLAWVHGDNRTDHAPLAQMPPLEARLGMEYDSGNWSLGSLLRLVAGQHRVDPGKGNIAGQDTDESGGFAVFSLNAGWRPDPRLRLAAGVDNVFDRRYAEHLSRAGAAIPGFEQTAQVNEPGRTVWVKATVALD